MRRTRSRPGGVALAVLVASAAALALTQQRPPAVGYDPLAAALEEAELERAAGRYGAALAATDRGLTYAPQSPAGRLLRGALLGDLGRHGEAIEVLDAWIAERGPSARALTERAQSHLARGRIDAAERDLRAALALYPASGPARAELIELLRRSGRAEQARLDLTRLRLQAPDLAWAVASEARLRVDATNVDAILSELSTAVAADDELGSIRRAAIEIALEAGRSEAAASAAAPWLADPAAAPDADALVLAARASDDDVTALRAALAAVGRDDRSPAALDALVDLLGRSDAMLEELLRERAADGDDPAALAWLVRRSLDEGRMGEALEMIGAEPATDELRLLAAEGLRRAGRELEAVDMLGPLCVDGGPARAFYERALARFARGSMEAAAVDFERAAQGELVALAQYNRGAVFDRLGRYARAAEAYELAVAADPSMGQAWVQLGNAYHFRLGERAKAANAYRRFLEVAGEDAQVRAWLEEVQ